MILNDLELRFFRLGATLKGISTVEQETLISSEISLLESSKGKDSGHCRSRFEAIAEYGQRHVERLCVLSGKRSRRLDMTLLENTLCQAERQIQDRPPTSRKVCCSCGRPVPRFLRSQAELG